MVSTYETLSKRARYNRRLLCHFAKRWKNEYLLGLMECYKPKGEMKEPAVPAGDIVLIKNDHEKRMFWKLAKIMELYTGKDGSVRSAKLQVAGDNKKVLTRSLKHLIPLECRSTNTRSDVDLVSSSAQGQAPAQLPVSTPPHLPQQVATQPQSQVNNRPKRNSATIGELRRQAFKH